MAVDAGDFLDAQITNGQASLSVYHSFDTQDLLLRAVRLHVVVDFPLADCAVLVGVDGYQRTEYKLLDHMNLLEVLHGVITIVLFQR